MSVIIRLQNLPLTANSIDIRNFFRGLSIPDGGVHIVGGAEGDAFIAFSTDEDARQGMQLSGTCLKDAPVKLLLSSRNEMYKVIEQARQQALGIMPVSSSGNSPGENSNSASSNLQQNPSSVSSIMNGNVAGLPLGIPPPSSSMLPLGMGFPIPGGATNSSLQQFQALNGSLGSGNLPNFASMMAGQPPPNFQGLFGTHPPPVTQNAAVNNMPLRANQLGQSNPFSFPPGSGTDLPINYPPSMHSNSLASNAVSVPGIQGLPNPSILNMSSMGNNGNQYAGGGMQRVSLLNSNPGPFSLPNNAQGLPNMPSMPSMLPTNANSNLGGTGLPGMAGNPGIRPSYNGGSQPQTTSAASREKRLEERSPNSFGKSSSGPNGNQSSSVGGRPEIRGRDRDRDRNERRRSQSRSKERKEARSRRRSRSREKSRERRRERRSTSRSRSRDRTRSRRTSRDRRDERRRSDASISSPDKTGVQGRRDHTISNGNKYSMNDLDSNRAGRDVEVVTIPDDSYGCVKLIGIHQEASYREIREFMRVDVEGGGEGVVRNFDKGIAFVKLSKPEDFGRLMRQNGQKLRGMVVKIEGVSSGVWQNEYKASKRHSERDKDQRDRDHRDRDRGDRPRTSRFNGGASQSSCISIRGLPTGITARDVTSNFFQGINVVDIAVVPQLSSSGRSTFTAYIQLDSPASAQKSVDVIVKSSEGSSYVVEFCEPDDILQAKRNFDMPSERDSETSSVVIAGVPAHASEKDILDFFSDIGLTPQNLSRMTDARNIPDGRVLVEFNDANKARRATSKDGTLFGRNAVVTVSLWSTRSNSQSSAMNHLNAPSQHINPFNIRGGRPALLGPRPTIPNAGNRFNAISSQSQNPFQQALNASNPMLNASHNRIRGPLGERPARFPANNNAGMGDDREGRGNHGSDRIDDMAIFDKPGCVVALENVPYKANMDDILNFLQEKLRVDIARNRIIRRFDDNQKPTGDARVAFQTPFEAKVASERLQGSYMWKRPINVSVLSYNNF